MKLYTLQIGKYRKAQEQGIPFLDTTVKSGHRAFAPTWDMVAGYKNGTIVDSDYAETYRQMMTASIEQNPQAWEHLLKYDTIAVSCYCKAHGFCHRYVLVEVIQKLCEERSINFEYCGEIE